MTGSAQFVGKKDTRRPLAGQRVTGTGRCSIAEARSESNVRGRNAAGGARRPEEKTSPHQHQVTIVTETTVDEVVAATKRDVEGVAIPKQRATDGQQKLLVNPRLQDSQMRNEYTPLGSRVRPVSNTAMKGKKTRARKSKRSGIQEHVGKYSVLSELANAPSGLTFWQMARDDADEENKEIRRLFTKVGRRGRALTAHFYTRPWGLRLVLFQIYGTEAKALLDSGATANLISPGLVSELLPVRAQR